MKRSPFVSLMPDHSVHAGSAVWLPDMQFAPHILYASGEKLLFSQAVQITSSEYTSGLGHGFRTDYQGFDGHGDLHFETDIFIYDCDGHVDFSLVFFSEGKGVIREIAFPAPLIADGENAYAVLNTMQG